MPIQTYVMEYNDEMVREAIERECARQGQVYYVYNRVEDIAELTARIQRLVPDVTVAFAHGQMREHELEKIMYAFINREIDVLVSTTIIETGLDIPNVNTMIIHDADRLGLSQLYQLRGRVGRSSRMATPSSSTGRISSSRRWRKSGSPPSGSSRTLAPGSGSPCGTWRSGGPGIFWGRSSTATWRRWDTTSTARC